MNLSPDACSRYRSKAVPTVDDLFMGAGDVGVLVGDGAGGVGWIGLSGETQRPPPAMWSLIHPSTSDLRAIRRRPNLPNSGPSSVAVAIHHRIVAGERRTCAATSSTVISSDTNSLPFLLLYMGIGCKLQRKAARM